LGALAVGMGELWMAGGLFELVHGAGGQGEERVDVLGFAGLFYVRFESFDEGCEGVLGLSHGVRLAAGRAQIKCIVNEIWEQNKNIDFENVQWWRGRFGSFAGRLGAILLAGP
jgi:hypothetical protein